MTHAEGATIAQREVDEKTNEITGFRPLLEALALAGVVVTAYALHAQREHARFLTEERSAHYVLGLKGNQPTLAAAAERLLCDSPVVHETHDKGYGRTEHRYIRVAAIPIELAIELGFPSARQFVAVDRERADLADRVASMETSYYVTDLSPKEAGPAELACYIRGHWGIENRSHFVHDRTFDEDRSQVRVGGAPQVLATLRNLAISILRLNGFRSIAAGLRWVAWDHTRAGVHDHRATVEFVPRQTCWRWWRAYAAAYARPCSVRARWVISPEKRDRATRHLAGGASRRLPACRTSHGRQPRHGQPPHRANGGPAR